MSSMLPAGGCAVHCIHPVHLALGGAIQRSLLLETIVSVSLSTSNVMNAHLLCRFLTLTRAPSPPPVNILVHICEPATADRLSSPSYSLSHHRTLHTHHELFRKGR
jgi:hypothetical protein